MKYTAYGATVLVLEFIYFFSPYYKRGCLGFLRVFYYKPTRESCTIIFATYLGDTHAKLMNLHWDTLILESMA